MVEASALLIGEQAKGTVAGSTGVDDGFLYVVALSGLREVVGQIGKVWLEIGCVDLFKRLAGLSV